MQKSISFSRLRLNTTKSSGSDPAIQSTLLFDKSDIESKNQLLYKLLCENIEKKPLEKIIDFCETELKAVSIIVDSQGDRKKAQQQLQDFYRNEYPNFDDAVVESHVNDRLNLFEKRSSDFLSIFSPNINRVAAKYTCVLQEIIIALDETADLTTEQEKNIRLILDASRDKYIQNIKVIRQANNTLNISLGSQNGTMGKFSSFTAHSSPPYLILEKFDQHIAPINSNFTPDQKLEVSELEYILNKCKRIKEWNTCIDRNKQEVISKHFSRHDTRQRHSFEIEKIDDNSYIVRVESAIIHHSNSLKHPMYATGATKHVKMANINLYLDMGFNLVQAKHMVKISQIIEEAEKEDKTLVEMLIKNNQAIKYLVDIAEYDHIIKEGGALVTYSTPHKKKSYKDTKHAYSEREYIEMECRGNKLTSDRIKKLTRTQRAELIRQVMREYKDKLPGDIKLENTACIITEALIKFNFIDYSNDKVYTYTCNQPYGGGLSRDDFENEEEFKQAKNNNKILGLTYLLFLILNPDVKSIRELWHDKEKPASLSTNINDPLSKELNMAYTRKLSLEELERALKPYL